MIKKNLTRVVILGSDSFIAKSLINRLIIDKKDIKIIKISRKEIDFANKNECSKLSDIILDNDSIFFVAAKAPVKDTEMMVYNIRMCQNICDAIINKNFSHITYVSSDAVYSDSEKKINEMSSAEPSSLHGLMHLSREKILESYFYDRLCIIRPTLVYGINDPHGGYGPNKFIKNAKNNIDINLFGQGEERRDHVYVEDVANISLRLIEDKYIGKINITSGTLYSFLEIAEFIIKRFKNKININFLKRNGPMPHNGYRAFDNKKINLIYKDFEYKLLNDWISEQ